MYLKFNPRATEVFTARIIHNEFYSFHVMLLYLSAYNIYIDRPLTLFNLCLAQTFVMGYNSQNVTPFHAPLTVRRQMYFPIRWAHAQFSSDIACRLSVPARDSDWMWQRFEPLFPRAGEKYFFCDAFV
jgi:hypothetical protein